MTEQLTPITPGEILEEEFMKPLNLNESDLSQALNVPISLVSAVIHGHKSISSDLALRLSRYFGNSAEFWLNLQQKYDLKMARKQLDKEIERTIKPHLIG